jgi:ribonuclease III
LLSEEGAEHSKKFHVACRLPDEGTTVTADGSSRRKAEQQAAGLLLEALAGPGRP